MRMYFVRQGTAVLGALEPHIVSVSNQFREANGKAFAATLLPSSLNPLRFATSSAEDALYEAAISSAIMGAARVLQDEMEASPATVPSSFAAEYLRDNSLSKLTGEIAATTKDRLQTALADAWEAGGSYEQIVGAVKDTFQDFSQVRADMIAQTETNDAYNAGRREAAEKMGFNEKSWETESGNPCPTCTTNEEEGWILFDQAHASGDDEPTAHPNCECIENYRMV